MAVKNVHMEHFDSGLFQLADGTLQIAQITHGDQGGGKDTFFVPDAAHASASRMASTSAVVGRDSMAPFFCTQSQPAMLP